MTEKQIPPTLDLPAIVDGAATVENLLDQAIRLFYSPSHANHFGTVMLHPSILPLGAKVKLAMAISNEIGVKLNKNALHKVLELRNAFAHHSTNAHPTIHLLADGGQKISHSLHVIDSQGIVGKLSRAQAAADFVANCQLARATLVALIAKINPAAKTGLVHVTVDASDALKKMPKKNARFRVQRD
jgi:hypothetical protein